jgi:hypothetical protein
VTVRRDFLIDHSGGQGAASKTGQLAEFFKLEAFGSGIDA